MQQINLYHPIFREQRRVFSASTVAAALGVVALALVGIWAFALHQVGRLEHELAGMQTRMTADRERIARVQPGVLDATAAEQRARDLASVLERRRRAAARLAAGDAGAQTGFSPRLEALARARIDGLWLTRIALEVDGVELSGAALAPTILPRYLESLGSEAALSGTRFEHVTLVRPEDRQDILEFELASEPPGKDARS